MPIAYCVLPHYHMTSDKKPIISPADYIDLVTDMFMEVADPIRANIMNQFLTEAVLICQMGGIVGIILGIVIGNVVALLLGGKFIMPWAWITLGLVTCTIVGLASGLYPALKAAKLDPIESLRYE